MWELDYDGALLLRNGGMEEQEFTASVFYKLSLRRYVREVMGGLVRFKSALTYLDYQKIIELCQKECARRKISLLVAPALEEYIQSRQLHIAIRSRLGVGIKERDPKLRERYAEYKAVVDQNMARALRDKQMLDSFFMCSMKRSANFSVPGSGKTASVLGMYAYLRAKGRVKRLVVICPKNAFGSWMDEFSVCFEGIEPLRVLNIHAPVYRTARQRAAALAYDAGRANLILVNYEAAGGMIANLVEVVDQNTLLVFDEVHKVKRVGGEHASHALRLAKDASYTVAMTGTPIPNSYADLYNLLHILYPDEYDEFFDFSVPMLKNPRPEEIAQINDRVQPFFCRTTKDELGVPPACADVIWRTEASADENRLLDILKMKYRKNPLALMIRLLQMESNPQQLLRTLDLKDFEYLLDESVEAGEIDYADYSQEVRTLIEGCAQTTKFTHCVQQARALSAQGRCVIIWCIFVDSMQRLAAQLQRQGIAVRCIYGEVPLEDRQQILRDFKQGKIQVLLTNPHTLAESVSLHSVCHDAIYFEYSYNLVHLLQSKDRIHRLGLPQGQYTQYYYEQVVYQTEEGEWSLDGAVYERLREKERIMLEAIAHRRLEILPTTDEDLDVIFSAFR